MVECQLPKLDVAGSTPVSRSIFTDIQMGSTPTMGATGSPADLRTHYLNSQADMARQSYDRVVDADTDGRIIHTRLPAQFIFGMFLELSVAAHNMYSFIH